MYTYQSFSFFFIQTVFDQKYRRQTGNMDQDMLEDEGNFYTMISDPYNVK